MAEKGVVLKEGALGAVVAPATVGHDDFEAMQSGQVHLRAERNPAGKISDTTAADEPEGHLRERRQRNERGKRVRPDPGKGGVEIELGQGAIEVRQHHEPGAAPPEDAHR